MIARIMLFFIVQLLLPLADVRHGWPPMSIKRHRRMPPCPVCHGTWGMAMACYLLLQPILVLVRVCVPMVSAYGCLPPLVDVPELLLLTVVD